MLEGYEDQPDSDLLLELTVCLISVEDTLGKEKHIIDITFLACLLCACLNLGTVEDVEDEDSFEDSETDKYVIIISDMILDEKIDDLKNLVEKQLAINNRFEVIIELKKENLI